MLAAGRAASRHGLSPSWGQKTVRALNTPLCSPTVARRRLHERPRRYFRNRAVTETLRSCRSSQTTIQVESSRRIPRGCRRFASRRRPDRCLEYRCSKDMLLCLCVEPDFRRIGTPASIVRLSTEWIDLAECFDRAQVDTCMPRLRYQLDTTHMRDAVSHQDTRVQRPPRIPPTKHLAVGI